MKIGLWVESPGLCNKLNEGSAFAQFALIMSDSIGTLRLKTHLNINRPIYIQDVSGGIVNILGGGSMDYSE